MGTTHPASDNSNRLRPAPAAALRAFRVSAGKGVDAEIAELLIEKAVIGASTELAIGHEAQAEPLLQCYRLGNSGVLRCGQIALRNFAACKARALLEQRRRAQQAADMLGTERRLLARPSTKLNIHYGRSRYRGLILGEQFGRATVWQGEAWVATSGVTPSPNIYSNISTGVLVLAHHILY